MLRIPATLVRELGCIGRVSSPARVTGQRSNCSVRIICDPDLSILKDSRRNYRGQGGQKESVDVHGNDAAQVELVNETVQNPWALPQ